MRCLYPVKPFPRFGMDEPSFFEWLTGWQWPIHDYPDTGGIAVTYKSNNTMFIWLVTSLNANGSIPNFISPNFDAKGKTYRQLTPDGPLTP